MTHAVLGGPLCLRAGDKIRKRPQVGGLATSPLLSGGPDASERGTKSEGMSVDITKMSADTWEKSTHTRQMSTYTREMFTYNREMSADIREIFTKHQGNAHVYHRNVHGNSGNVRMEIPADT